ncbi:MAG: SDR family oxidoreductase [Alkalinema sp. RU_4_3]|nr:SDR family oxidoreductase [Alkalinema sp. RU_4_3]
MTSPTERYALITGAGSGIGKAIALAFARSGVHLVLVGRTLGKLEAVATEAQVFGVKTECQVVDLTDLSNLKEKIQAIAQGLPHLDIVINNAGMGHTGNLIDTTLADWQRVMDLNLTAVFLVIQGVLPTLRSQSASSTILNISSIAGHQVFPGWGPYCVSKFGLMALTKALAQEERSNGIRAMTVSPGSVNTPLWDTDTVDADFDRTAMLTPEMVAESVVHAALMPAQAAIEDLILMPNAGTF